MKLYNTLTRKKEIFKPRERKIVELFVCGITPYDSPHIGHARTYLIFDMFVKYLKEKGCPVFYLQNITDIDDRIIKRAKEKKTSPEKLAQQFEKEYLADMKTLRVNSVTKYARATDHIKEIIGQVERLLKKGYAYQIEDGIYYNIKKFKDYGKLSRRTVLQAEDAVSRIDQAQEKKNKGDFCLWKFSKPGEPSWPFDSSLRSSLRVKAGRPGWHIEDTAIAEKFFGYQYDIHGGGRDLIFPHHEAEISQMEALSGKTPFVQYWLHTGFLTVRGQKMAKSLGNFITIKDFVKKHSARLLRFLVLKNLYRSPLDYNEKALIQVKRELEKIDEFIGKLKKSDFPNIDNRKSDFLNINKFQKNFEGAMEDDFNTPQAMAIIFELINQGNSLINRNLLTKTDTQKILEFFRKIDRFFNFIFWKKTKEKIPPAVLSLTEQRERLRKRGQWKEADEIRQEIKKTGWWVEDTKAGPQLKKT